MRHGRWTTHPEPGVRYGMLDKVPCVCDCGTKRSVRRDRLEYGLSVSCGCYNKDQLAGRKHPNLAPQRSDTIEPGSQFGRWTIISEPQPGKDRTVNCRCECGTEKTIAIRHLLSGRSKSCGCLRRDSARAMMRGS